MNKISTIIPTYHEGKAIEETLKSIKGVVDEIIVVHDGPCTDDTLKIARKYTNKVFEKPREGRSAFSTAFGLKKAKYNWILKLDADESLSEDLRKNIRRLVEEDFDSFSFIHPLWDGKKCITKTMPRKTALMRKSKISYLGFPGFDMNVRTLGTKKDTHYILYHKPTSNQDVGWKGFNEKVLKRYANSSAKYILMDFNEFPTFQYDKKDFPLRIKIRKVFPIVSNVLYAFLVLFKQMFFEKVWKEKPMIQVMIKTFIFNVWLGFLIQKLEIKESIRKFIEWYHT